MVKSCRNRSLTMLVRNEVTWAETDKANSYLECLAGENVFNRQGNFVCSRVASEPVCHRSNISGLIRRGIKFTCLLGSLIQHGSKNRWGPVDFPQGLDILHASTVAACICLTTERMKLREQSARRAISRRSSSINNDGE